MNDEFEVMDIEENSEEIVNPDTETEETPEGEISTGGLVGIIVGGAALLGGVGYGIKRLVQRHKEQKAYIDMAKAAMEELSEDDRERLLGVYMGKKEKTKEQKEKRSIKDLFKKSDKDSK